jgi:hypothetical protein
MSINLLNEIAVSGDNSHDPGRGKTFLSSWYAQREVQRKSRLSEFHVDLFLPQCIYLFLFTIRQIAEMVLRKYDFYCISEALKLFRKNRCYPLLYCPPQNATWSHRSESELLKMHALLN